MDDDRVTCVRRGGLLNALAYGFFGTISVIVICATAVAIIAMTIVSDRINQFLSPSPDIVSAISEWQNALPPAMTPFTTGGHRSTDEMWMSRSSSLATSMAAGDGRS